MNQDFSIRPNSSSPLLLFILTLVNYGLMYVANIFLAQNLSIEEFDDYSVAVSIVTLLSTVATLGLEKYALRLMALYLVRQAWSKLKGFWDFSIKFIFLFSFLLMAILNISLESLSILMQTNLHPAILIYAVFLPFIALTMFLVEVITVYGYQIVAISLYRLLLPFTYIILMLVTFHWFNTVSAISAVICFGVAWIITVVSMAFTSSFINPIKEIDVDMKFKRKKWLKRAFPMVLSSLLMTIINSGGVVILELLYPSEAMVGIYAIALNTANLIALIGTSTNRYYLPLVVVFMERKDLTSMTRLMMNRSLIIGSVTLLFVIIIVVFGDVIFSLFGPHYKDGYSTLVMITIGASINTLFSDSPYYLQFIGRHRLVVGLLSVTVLINVILSIVLGNYYGSFGVAVAYSLPLALLFLIFKMIASREVSRVTVN